MYQSVLAKRQGSGSSAVGFAFTLVDVSEVHPDTNICLVSDVQTGAFTQVGLDKRDSIAWPQVGDRWIIDRSLGHWALRCKVTATAPPVITGSRNSIGASAQMLLDALEELGLVNDQTTPATLPVGVWQVVGSGAPVAPFTAPWANYDATTYQGARYMIETSGIVRVEGLAKTTAAVSGASEIFVLPPGFRPLKHQEFCVFRNGGFAHQYEIFSTGSVQLANVPSSTTVGYVNLSAAFSTL
jgi:hypothetical protein